MRTKHKLSSGRPVFPIAIAALLALASLGFASCSTAQLARLGAFDYVAAHARANPGSESIVYEALSPGEPLMWKLSLAGSYRELGRQIGRVGKGSPTRPILIKEGDRKLNAEIRRLYERIYPQHLEIVAGVAEAYGIPVDDIDLRHMEQGFFVDLGWIGFDYQRWTESGFPVIDAGCSIAAVDSPSGTLVGRNFDWYYSPGFLVSSGLEGSYESIGATIITGQHWIMDGMNEKGLFIGVMTIGDPEYEALSMAPYPDEPAINAHHMMRIVLDTCSTVEEAIALVSGFRVWFSAEWLHFLVADASGGKAVFEFDKGGRLRVVRPEAGEPYLLSTNSYLADDPLNAYWSCPRYSAGRAILKKKVPGNLGELREFMLRLSPNPGNAEMFRGAPKKSIEKYLKSVQTRWQSYYDLSAKKMIIYPSGEALTKGYELGFTE